MASWTQRLGMLGLTAHSVACNDAKGVHTLGFCSQILTLHSSSDKSQSKSRPAGAAEAGEFNHNDNRTGRHSRLALGFSELPGSGCAPLSVEV